jgi:hypothetical protein
MVTVFYVHSFSFHLWSSGQIFCKVVGLKRGPLSLVGITEELLQWKIASESRRPRLTAVGIRCPDHATPSIRKS